jgi:transcriptional regulator of nitric oxide reductase
MKRTITIIMKATVTRLVHGEALVRRRLALISLGRLARPRRAVAPALQE